MSKSKETRTVGLFVTCLVDLMRPTVGFATVKLLEDAGFRVEVPPGQTCCGQPAWNSGDRTTARDLARSVIETFGPFDVVVVPSGSCAAMICEHYPTLFTDAPDWRARAEDLGGRVLELTEFLDGEEARTSGRLEAKATYHDSCSGLRELGIKEQPRKLLAGIEGLTLVEGAEAETCCGFGGAFCAKYPEISRRMTDAKADDVETTGADLVLGGDLGCLLTVAARLKARGSRIEVRHLAEVLAGMTDVPAIGK